MKKFLHKADEEFFPSVVPAKDNFPAWYKSMPRSVKITPVNFGPEEEHMAIKACVPFMDSFLVGYQIPLICDLLISEHEGSPFYTWSNEKFPPMEVRPNDFDRGFPVPNYFSNDRPVWLTKQNFRIPSGYSALVTHPLNRLDLPFFTLSGIVDDFDVFPGRLPFFLDREFRGLIPKGTPIAQIIPFKREPWKNEQSEKIRKSAKLNSQKNTLIFSGWYRKNIWKKKSFE